MILLQEENTADLNFEITMMEQNNLKGFLKFHIQQVNLGFEYWYEISARHPLSHVLSKKKLNFDEIQFILIQLYSAFETLDNYLIDVDRLLLNPEYIYTDPDNLQLYFCFFPNKQNSFTNSMKEFIQFILDRVDHNDNRAIATIYPIYSYCTLENFTIEGIMKFLNPVKEFDDVNIANTEVNIKQEKKELIISPIEKSRIQKETEILHIKAMFDKLPIILSVTVIIAVVIILFLKYRENNSWPIYGSNILVGVFVTFCAFVGLFFLKQSKVKHEVRRTINNKSQEECNELRDIENDKINYSNETIMLEKIQHAFPHYLKSTDENNYENICCTKYPYMIGRFHNCDHVIESPYISRFHAQVLKDDEEIAIKDLNSMNGTYVNGRRLEANESKILRFGDEVALANFCYKYI